MKKQQEPNGKRQYISRLTFYILSALQGDLYLLFRRCRRKSALARNGSQSPR